MLSPWYLHPCPANTGKLNALVSTGTQVKNVLTLTGFPSRALGELRESGQVYAL